MLKNLSHQFLQYFREENYPFELVFSISLLFVGKHFSIKRGMQSRREVEKLKKIPEQSTLEFLEKNFFPLSIEIVFLRGIMRLLNWINGY